MPSNGYDQLPRVNFSVDTHQFSKLRATAETLARLGMPEALQEYEREYARAKVASKVFIRNASAEEVDKAQQIERDLVGGKKSGYVPTGTLQGSITGQISDDGMKVSVVPLATAEDAEKARKNAKNGKKKEWKAPKNPEKSDSYYYGAAVEFGLGHNPREPFMKPSGEKVSAHLDKEFETTVRKALER